MDIKSGANSYNRAEFKRMLSDCRDGKLDIVITKSISRFGRNTVDMLSAIKELRAYGVEVIFELEDLTTAKNENMHLITIIEAVAQEINAVRSENIKWGMLKRAQDNNYSLYKRRCFGYITDENGDLQINNDEASVVRLIFELYLSGFSIIGITRDSGVKKRRI
jgi:DNA invertase Pin-like site-specific DNA recombinase